MPGGTCSSRAWPSWLRSSPSISSVTRCRTRSTRRRGGTDFDKRTNTGSRSSRQRKETDMRSTTRWLFALVAAAVLAFVVSACGSDDDDGDSSSGGTGIPEEYLAPTEAADDAQEGGDLKVIA